QPQEDGYSHRCSSSDVLPRRPCQPRAPCGEWFFDGAARGDNVCIVRAGYGGLASGSIRCALDDDRLGRALTPDAGSPGLDRTLATLSQFSLGLGFACGVQLDGRVACWGDLSRLRDAGPRARTSVV